MKWMNGRKRGKCEDRNPLRLALYHTLELCISLFGLQIVFPIISQLQTSRVCNYIPYIYVVFTEVLIVKDTYMYR